MIVKLLKRNSISPFTDIFARYRSSINKPLFQKKTP